MEQEFCLSLELYHSVGGQEVFTNVNMAEQLWLECSQDQYVRNQWESDNPVDWSEI